MSRKVKKLCVAVFLVGILIFYFYRIYYVNHLYPDIKVVDYDEGEVVSFESDVLMDGTMEGYSVTVNSAEILDYKDYLKKYHLKDEYSYMPEKILDVDVTFYNNDAKEGGIDLNQFYIQSVGACNGTEQTLTCLANPDIKENLAFALKPQSGMELHLPFMMFQEHYEKHRWEHLEKEEIYFIATLYPTKKRVLLTDIGR